MPTPLVRRSHSSQCASGAFHACAATGSSNGLSAAIARMSSVIFIEQYFGPHMLQEWAASAGCGAAAVSGEQRRNVVRRGWRLLSRRQCGVE